MSQEYGSRFTFYRRSCLSHGIVRRVVPSVFFPTPGFGAIKKLKSSPSDDEPASDFFWCSPSVACSKCFPWRGMHVVRVCLVPESSRGRGGAAEVFWSPNRTRGSDISTENMRSKYSFALEPDQQLYALALRHGTGPRNRSTLEELIWSEEARGSETLVNPKSAIPSGGRFLWGACGPHLQRPAFFFFPTGTRATR